MLFRRSEKKVIGRDKRISIRISYTGLLNQACPTLNWSDHLGVILPQKIYRSVHWSDLNLIMFASFLMALLTLGSKTSAKPNKKR